MSHDEGNKNRIADLIRDVVEGEETVFDVARVDRR